MDNKLSDKLKIAFLLLFIAVFLIAIISIQEEEGNDLVKKPETHNKTTETATDPVRPKSKEIVVYDDAEILFNRLGLYLNQYESKEKTAEPFHDINVISDVNGIKMYWEFDVEYTKIPKEEADGFILQIDRLKIDGIQDGFPAFTIDTAFRVEESGYCLYAEPFEIEAWFEHPTSIPEGVRRALLLFEENLLMEKEEEVASEDNSYEKYLEIKHFGYLRNYYPEGAELVGVRLLKGKETTLRRKGNIIRRKANIPKPIRLEETELYKEVQKMRQEDEEN